MKKPCTPVLLEICFLIPRNETEGEDVDAWVQASGVSDDSSPGYLDFDSSLVEGITTEAVDVCEASLVVLSIAFIILSCMVSG